MSGFLERAMLKRDSFVEGRQACLWFRESHPALYEVLAGQDGKDGGTARMPGGVRLFSNNGELKAEITGQDWVMRGYLIVPKGLLTFEALEAELAAGRIGWSPKSEQTSTSRKAPY